MFYRNPPKSENVVSYFSLAYLAKYLLKIKISKPREDLQRLPVFTNVKKLP
jgi:hypothetical protein